MNAFLLIFNSANSELLWRRTRQALLGKLLDGCAKTASSLNHQ